VNKTSKGTVILSLFLSSFNAMWVPGVGQRKLFMYISNSKLSSVLKSHHKFNSIFLSMLNFD
jgi:hypothetical protein